MGDRGQGSGDRAEGTGDRGQVSPLLSPIPSNLPPTYAEAIYWRLLSDWRRVVAANLLALGTLPVVAVCFGALGVLATGLSPAGLVDRLDAGSDLLTGLALAGVIVGSIAAHELTHGLAIRLCGNRPSYGFQWAGLIPYATAEGQFFSRDQYIAVALAPVFGLSVLGCLTLGLIPTGLVPWLLLGLVGNAAGSVGDVWMSAVALRYPRGSRIMDERDGMRIFVRQ